jgi:magnesium-transporting ATPase (P-type)
MRRPPRPRSERLLNLRVMARVYAFVGLLVGVAGLASFFLGYLLAGWTPGEELADSGDIYVQATAMTCAGIVAGQVGAGMAFRTNLQSVFSVGLLTNRFLLVGIAFEIVLLVMLVTVPLFQDAFHMRPLDPLAWPLLLIWPPLVFGAEELRKALLRRRRSEAVAP